MRSSALPACFSTCSNRSDPTTRSSRSKAARPSATTNIDGYKANRGAMPDDLRSQVHRVREIIEAMNIPIIEREGFEADDVIGSLSHKLADDNHLHVLIITGDSDLLQLVEPGVEAVLPGRPRFQDLAHLRCSGGRGSVRVRAGADSGLQGVGRGHVRQHPGRSRHRRQDGEIADPAIRRCGGHPGESR